MINIDIKLDTWNKKRVSTDELAVAMLRVLGKRLDSLEFN